MTRLSGGASLQVERSLGDWPGTGSCLCVRRNRHGIKEQGPVMHCCYDSVLAVSPTATGMPALSVLDQRGPLSGVDVEDTTQQCYNRGCVREAL